MVNVERQECQNVFINNDHTLVYVRLALYLLQTQCPVLEIPSLLLIGLSILQYAGINIGPVHKRDVMKASVMLEHDSQ